MLKEIKYDLKTYYYDPKFRGLDIDARFKEADQKINEAQSTGQIFSIIAQVLIDLNDSHTRFFPPALSVSVDYGWRMQMIGDKCYVVAVKAGSDAASKGLKVGDVVYSIDGFEPTRESLWKIEYSNYTLQPAPGMRVVVQDPDGKLRQIEIAAKVSKAEKTIIYFEDEFPGHPPLYHEMGDDLIICKLPQFDLNDDKVDEMMRKVASHKALILDLRGNPGGYEKMIQRLIGYFFDHDSKIADSKGRSDSHPVMAKTRGEHAFKGQLVVLVDSKSTSASEIFARVVQLEKRGTIIGDRSGGMVMVGSYFSHPFTYVSVRNEIIERSSFYGGIITIRDLIMTDGKSLENVGGVPDELLLPSSSDLATRRDPVLARAAALLGIKLDAEKAGTLFIVEGKK